MRAHCSSQLVHPPSTSTALTNQQTAGWTQPSLAGNWFRFPPPPFPGWSPNLYPAPAPYTTQRFASCTLAPPEAKKKKSDSDAGVDGKYIKFQMKLWNPRNELRSSFEFSVPLSSPYSTFARKQSYFDHVTNGDSIKIAEVINIFILYPSFKYLIICIYALSGGAWSVYPSPLCSGSEVLFGHGRFKELLQPIAPATGRRARRSQLRRCRFDSFFN